MIYKKATTGFLQQPLVEQKKLPSLPPEVVIYKILLRIPYKSLCRFKSVCKDWDRVMSFDDKDNFMKLRSEFMACSGAASTLVSLDDNQDIVFFDNMRRIGCGDLFKEEVNVKIVDILASTNGLLCLCCLIGDAGFLYLFHPATREERDRIPLPKDYAVNESMGLGFDPATDHYTLVYPQSRQLLFNEVEYLFEIFSSDRREWIRLPHQVVIMNDMLTLDKSVFADGVLYWYCKKHLVLVDCEKKLPNSIKMPADEQNQFLVYTEEIGVCESQVTCIRMYATTLDVWKLVRSNGQKSRSYKWEKVCHVRIEEMVERNNVILSSLQISMGQKTGGMNDNVVVLPYEGRERLFFRLSALPKPVILCYDINTGRLAEVLVNHQSLTNAMFAWGYPYNMAFLPK